MAVGLAIVSAVGTGISLYGQYKAGQNAKDVAEDNAAIIEDQADFTKQQSIDDAARLEEQGTSFLSQQRAGYGASGVRLDSGSPLSVMQKSKENLDQDVSRVLAGGEFAKESLYSQAGVTRQQGQNAATASYWNMGSTFLTGGSDAYSLWKGL